MKQTLLVELLTEELPPKALLSLGLTFRNAVIAGLAGAKFVDADSQQPEEVLATPRRLAVTVRHVAAVQADQEIERKGPYVSQGLGADGKPTKALLGFARSCGVEVDALEKGQDAKGAHYVFRSVKRGEPLDEHLADIVTQALKKLPTPKLMRWGNRDVQFVRPVHGLVLLHGDRVVRGEVLGIAGSNATRGHRFMGEGAVTVPNAEAYADTLAQRGAVIAGFTQRRKAIAEALAGEAARLKAVLHEDEALLDEVTALVEFPVVYSGAFEPDFLAVPQECLILSMKQHQKYFPLFDAKGKLLPRFLIVSNLKTADPSDIVRGNERVLRARLSDAKFFFDQDRKRKLADRVPRLGDVVYHNKLGTQLERVARMQKLAGHIAERLGTDVVAAERAAWLCKADLLTEMVGEFPELQGIMGMYYAQHDGEADSVARAIEAHYHPRFANDSLPQENVGAAVALADKLDTLTGIFGIGLVPTGDKDPFALRRHALGVLRILAESQLPLDLLQLLQFARSQFSAETVADSVAADVHAFMLDRLRGYLRDRGFAADEVDAVVSQNPRRIDLVLPRLEAVRAFRHMPEAGSLAAANKRIRNILRKADGVRGAPDMALLQESAEKKLFGAVNALSPKVDSLVENEGYTDALKLLAGVKGEVDAFFDEVMVMTDDPLTRDNRLALLDQLEKLMNRVADISRLAP
ncbi:MAG: glycine--tRNA ligase subunit beta [Burkholderiales bacterium]